MSREIRLIYYNIFMIIAQRIRELRKEACLTQGVLAEKVGCSQSMVARWEKEECEPTASAIVRLAEAFGCSCDYLLGKTDSF